MKSHYSKLSYLFITVAIYLFMRAAYFWSITFIRIPRKYDWYAWNGWNFSTERHVFLLVGIGLLLYIILRITKTKESMGKARVILLSLGLLAASIVSNQYPKWIFDVNPTPDSITIYNQMDHELRVHLWIPRKEVPSERIGMFSPETIAPGENLIFSTGSFLDDNSKNELMLKLEDKSVSISICDSRLPTMKGEFEVYVSGDYDVRIIDVHNSCFWAKP